MKWGRYWQAAHQESKDLGFGSPSGPGKFLDGSIFVETKKYEGFEVVQLPAFPAAPVRDASFVDVATKRTSARSFSGHSITLAQLADILQLSAGSRVPGKDEPRMQPSAGKRYPIEIYVLPFRVEGLESYSYHYRPSGHQLEKLFSFTDSVPQFTKEDWVAEGAVLILMTGVFSRTAVRYGARSYRYVLLEAGHIGQSMLLAAHAIGITGSPIGGLDDVYLERHLDIDGANESLVYGVVLGCA